jgi:hypothetical protein
MTDGSYPTRIAIDHDDYHAKHVGHTADGRQFFLTTPFVPRWNDDLGQEFVALFLFDADGVLVEALIDALGPRSAMDREHAQAVYEARLRDLGEVTFDRIVVAPFAVERFNTTFGLIVEEREDEDDEDDEAWCVELHPGNYMAFTAPWDSGEYDT